MQDNKQQERTLSYTLAQKLDEADLEKVAGGTLATTHGITGCVNGIDYHWDS